MKKLIAISFVLSVCLWTYCCLIRGRVHAQSAASQRGSIVINGEFVTEDGCMSWLNNSAFKKGCELEIVLPGVKLKGANLSVYKSINDMLLYVTYEKAVETVDPSTLNTRAGTMTVNPSLLTLDENGCFAEANDSMYGSSGCGFNVVLRNFSVDGSSCSLAEKDGNAVMTCTYDKRSN